MFSKWQTLLFWQAAQKSTAVHCTGGYPEVWRTKKWTPAGSSIKPTASYVSPKMKKREKQMAKQINYMKKNHVTCQISTLSCVAVSVFFSYSGTHFWDWILKTLYIINTLHASSIQPRWDLFFFLFRLCFDETKSNKHTVCSGRQCSFFLIQHIMSQRHLLNSTRSLFRLDCISHLSRSEKNNLRFKRLSWLR